MAQSSNDPSMEANVKIELNTLNESTDFIYGDTGLKIQLSVGNLFSAGVDSLVLPFLKVLRNQDFETTDMRKVSKRVCNEIEKAPFVHSFHLEIEGIFYQMNTFLLEKQSVHHVIYAVHPAVDHYFYREMSFNNILDNLYSIVFDYAGSMKTTSIAIPLFSSGDYKVPIEKYCDAFFRALASYVAQRGEDSPLKLIKILTNDAAEYTQAQSRFVFPCSSV